MKLHLCLACCLIALLTSSCDRAPLSPSNQADSKTNDPLPEKNETAFIAIGNPLRKNSVRSSDHVSFDALAWQKTQWNSADKQNLTATTRAYVLLSFLHAGYDHKSPSSNKLICTELLDSILSIQRKDGTFGTDFDLNRDALCCGAIAETYGMTQDPLLKTAIERSVHWLLSQQIHHTGWANIENNQHMLNMRCTLLCCMALKSARSSGYKNDQLDAAWDLLREWTKNADIKQTSWPMDINLNDGTQSGTALEETACVFILCGVRVGDVRLDTIIDELLKTACTAQWPLDPFQTYAQNFAFFQYGGEAWKKWTLSTRALIKEQQLNTDSQHSGSWDIGQSDLNSQIQSTVLFTFIWQVYYCYERILPLKQ